MWPIVLVCTDQQYKVAVYYELNSNLFDVKVDDYPYTSLPYIAPNHNYGDAKDEVFTAIILVNNKVVFDETIHWNFFSISEQVELKLGADSMTSF